MTRDEQRQLLARACADELSPDEASRLLEACRRRGVLHLLVAHHADDQGETDDRPSPAPSTSRARTARKRSERKGIMAAESGNDRGIMAQAGKPPAMPATGRRGKQSMLLRKVGVRSDK